MPCCRQKVQPVSHAMDMASGRACCTQTAADSADMSGCRFAKASPALPLAVESVLGITAAVGAVVCDNAIERPFHQPLVGPVDSRPPSAPLYLHLQTLLI